MHKLPALAVPGHDDLGPGTVGHGLRGQVGHELGPLGIAAVQEAGDVGRVVDPLHGEVLGADLVGHGLEKGRAGEGTHVALLGGAARKDDDVGGAVAGLQPVLLIVAKVLVLAYREGCGCGRGRGRGRGRGEGCAGEGGEEEGGGGLVHHFY